MKRPAPEPFPPRQWSRREAMQLGATAAMGASVVGAGLLLRRKYDLPPAASGVVIRDHRVERPAGAVELAIARGPDPAKNVRRALEAMGGMGAFVKSGDRVVIKPNVGWNRLPEQAANTNPDVVAEVVRHVMAAGASKVWVTDYPVNSPERCFERSGIRRAAGDAGATLVMPDTNAFREVAVQGKVLKAADVLWPFVEADKVINLPVAKHHGLSRATLSMKNWYGVLGGHRVRLHQDLHRSIVDLATMVKPTLTILDATRLLLANGPTGGSLADVKRYDAVAVGVDQVAIDAFGAELLGLAPADVGFIVEAEKAGLGSPDWKSLKYEDIPA
jgi:uncharacterized protein (DUF362 family)